MAALPLLGLIWVSVAAVAPAVAQNARPSFSLGRYSLGMPAAELPSVTEAPSFDDGVWGRPIAGGKNFRAPAILLAGNLWRTGLGIENGKVYRIALHLETEDADDGALSAYNLLSYCEARLGPTQKVRGGVYSWLAAQGAVTLQLGWAGGRYTVHLSLADGPE
jgi:hypothetical protein